MAGKSSIHRLPAEIKTYIEAQLATGCHTLDSLIEDLRERFPAEANAGRSPAAVPSGATARSWSVAWLRSGPAPKRPS